MAFDVRDNPFAARTRNVRFRACQVRFSFKSGLNMAGRSTAAFDPKGDIPHTARTARGLAEHHGPLIRVRFSFRVRKGSLPRPSGS